MSGCIESEVLRQVALYSGVSRDDLHGAMLLCEDLGLGPLTVLMLLITLSEALEMDILTLRFDLDSLETVADLVALFCPATACDMTRVSHCLH